MEIPVVKACPQNVTCLTARMASSPESRTTPRFLTVTPSRFVVVFYAGFVMKSNWYSKPRESVPKKEARMIVGQLGCVVCRRKSAKITSERRRQILEIYASVLLIVMLVKMCASQSRIFPVPSNSSSHFRVKSSSFVFSHMCTAARFLGATQNLRGGVLLCSTLPRGHATCSVVLLQLGRIRRGKTP